MFDSKKSQNKFINDLNEIKLPEKSKILPAEAFIPKSETTTRIFNRKKLYPSISFGIAIIVLSSVLLLQIGLPNLSGLITDENSSVDSNSEIISEFQISDNLQFSRIKIPSINWLIENSDLIIIGNVLDNSQVLQVGGEHILNSKNKIKIYQFTLNKNTVSIKNILYGNEDSKEIIIAQLALPGYDYLQTKLYKGDRVILFLNNKEDNIYIPVTFEEAFFKIVDDDIVYSFSNDKVVAKYNGGKVDVLIKDIENIVKK